MRRKKIIGLLFVGILIVVGAIVMEFLSKDMKITESEESIENIKSVEIAERTDEEYISILLDNQEDFDYIAKIMMQWPEKSYIHFEKNDISSNDPEITGEILSNEELCGHLKKLYDLEEIGDIVRWSDRIEFSLSKPPKDYIGGFCYWENVEECDLTRAKIIDDHWMLEILPAI